MSNSSGLRGRERHLEPVSIAKVRVSPLAQRDLKPAWVDKIAAEFNFEEFGTPTVNLRDGWWYVIDGQHRFEALRQLGFADDEVDCWVYHGLTEEEEARKFLILNNVLPVAVFPKFRVGVEAGKAEDTEINNIVRACGLHVSLDKNEGAIGAVGALRTIYRRDGGDILARSLTLVSEAYGTPGLRAIVVNGVALFCARYGDSIDNERFVEKLGNIRGGVNGLLGRADTIHRQTGNRRPHCVAAATVAIYNSGKTGAKLKNWWKGGREG